MLGAFINHALRSLGKNKASFAINTFGFAIGLSGALLLLAYVYHQFNYESAFDKRDRIYRLDLDLNTRGKITSYAPNTPAAGPAIKEALPGVENLVRIKNDFPLALFKYNDGDFVKGENIYVVDSSYFDVFNTTFISGSQKVLADVDQIVLTESLAKRIFGKTDPMGKSLVINTYLHVSVGGIIKDPPGNSHLKYQGLMSWHSFPEDEVWDDAHAYTYILLNSHTDKDEFQAKLNRFVSENRYINDVERSLGAKFSMILTPISAIHLHSQKNIELSQNSTPGVLYIFIVVAVFFLLCSSFNYINAGISGSLSRTKEIGVRKVFGALREEIRIQYLLESLCVILFAFLIAIIVTMLVLPSFSQLLGDRINLGVLLNFKFIIMIVMLIVIVSMLSAIYPAFYLSSFNPVETLNTIGSVKGGHIFIRKLLIVLQLTISTGVIASILIIFLQFNYIAKLDVGFDKNNVVMLNMPGGSISQFKQEIASRSYVKAVAASSYDPSSMVHDEFRIQEQSGEMHTHSVQRMFMDHAFLDLLDIKVAKGRNFRKDSGADSTTSVLVNEAMVKSLGWTDPIGKRIEAVNFKKDAQVIGVVRNASLYSLHNKNEPMVISLSNDRFTDGEKVFIRLNGVDNNASISDIKDIYARFFGDLPFEYTYLEDVYDSLYRSDNTLRKVLWIGSLVIIVISCLGLYNLSSFLAIKRSREIGIRKVVGASSMHIVVLHFKYFSWLSLVGSVLACPVVYLVARKWLQSFSMQVNPGIGVFLIASLLSFMIVIIATISHAYKLSRINPVSILKD